MYDSTHSSCATASYHACGAVMDMLTEQSKSSTLAMHQCAQLLEAGCSMHWFVLVVVQTDSCFLDKQSMRRNEAAARAGTDCCRNLARAQRYTYHNGQDQDLAPPMNLQIAKALVCISSTRLHCDAAAENR